MILGFLFLFLFYKVQAQKILPIENNKHLLRFSLGVGYDDGLVLLAQTPSLGISYEYQIHHRLALTTHLLSYYRTMPDSYFDKSPNGGHAIVDLIAPGVTGPFATAEDLEQVKQGGIKTLSSHRTIKMLSVPLDVGLTFYPISHTHHKIGLNLAFSMTYESSNWPRDYFEQVTITLEDGTTYDQAFLSLNTEFRNWTPGASAKLFYEYHFKEYALGLRAGNYNVFFFGDANHPIWETSIYFAFKW